MKTSKVIVLTVIFGIIVSFLISFFIGLEQTLNALAKANLFFLFIAFLFNWLSILCINQRWRMVVKSAGIKVSNNLLLLATLSGVAFSNITPSSRMGGEPIKAYFLNKFGKTNTKHSFATIVGERLFDSITFTIVALSVLVFVLVSGSLPLYLFLILVFTVLLALAVTVIITFISINSKTRIKLIKWSLGKFKWLIKKLKQYEEFEAKVIEDSEKYSKNIRKFLKNKYLWVVCVYYSLLVWAFDVLRIYFVFLALGVNVQLHVILTAIVLSAVAGALPFLPGGLGAIETTMIGAYSASGISLVVAGVGTLIDRFISYWLFSFIGLVSSYYLKRRLKHDYKLGSSKRSKRREVRRN